MRETIKSSFTRASATYDRLAYVQDHAAGQLARMFRERVGKRRPGAVLEIGAGSGLLTRRLAELVPAGGYTANDLTESFTADYLRWGCVPLPGDASSIDLPGGQDAVVSSSCFQWIADLPVFFRKLYGCLNSDGLLCFSTFGPDNFYQVKEMTGSGLDYPAGEDIARMLQDAGFSAVVQRQEKDMLYFASALEMLRYFSGTGVNAAGRSFWTPGRLTAFETMYRARYSPDGRLPLTVDYLWFSAVKKP